MSPNAQRNAVVIEDDVEIRNLIRAVLERAGLHATVSSNGLEGIAAVRAVHPFVITVDIRMPGIDGYETIRRIRAMSNACIVALTALTSKHDEEESIRSGADFFMTKPFRPRELQAWVAHLLRGVREN